MTVYFIIGAYLLLTLAVGWFGFKRANKTPEDYFMANRGVGAIVMLFTFIASNFSAFFFLGFAGAGYRIGYSYYPMMAFGTAFAALAFYFIGYRTWLLGKKFSYITPPEMIGDMTNSKMLKILFFLVMVFFTLPYLAIQPMGAGYILETLTDGQIPYFTGAVILTVFIVLYVFVGGMRTVAITDLIQGVLMFGLMLLAVWAISADLGGLVDANAKVYEQKPELFTHEGGNEYFSPQRWFSLMILWLFCVPMFPHMFIRFFISKDTFSLKFSTFFYALIPCFLFILPIIIGVIGHLSYPGLSGDEADKIIPMMLMKHTPLWIAALVLTGALAAFMSSLDSQLLAISTMFTRDIYLSFLNKKASLKQQVVLGRLLVVLCAIIGLFIAAYAKATIFSIVKMAFTGYAALFPTTVAVLYFKNINPWACVVSIITGEFLIFGLYLEWLPTGWTMGFEPVVPVILIASLIIMIGCLPSLSNIKPRYINTS